MMRSVISLVLAGLVLPSATTAHAAPFVYPADTVHRLADAVAQYDEAPTARAARTLGLPIEWVTRFANAFDLDIGAETADSLIRLRLEIRDTLHVASKAITLSPVVLPFARLAELSDRQPFRAPDVSILSVFPLPASDTSWATSGFGWREDPMRHRRKFHSGADVRAKPGTPVFAAGDGVVIFAGRMNGYGNLVTIDHGGGVVTRYAHLRRIHTTKGAVIGAGARLGQVGSTGRATGPHLHFEVRLDDRPVNPDTALAVAAMQREGAVSAQLAAFALDPELMRNSVSDLDPPKAKRSRAKIAKSRGSRPERAGRSKRVKPVS